MVEAKGGKGRFRKITSGRAFTLVELLVVIAIITILAAFLLPALRQALEIAKTTACMSQQKQVASLLQLYQSDYHGYIPGNVHRHSGKEYYWHTFIDGDLTPTPPGIGPDSYFDGGVGQEESIFRCNKNTGDFSSGRNSYGVVGAGGGEDDDFSGKTFWDPAYTGSSFQWFKLNKMMYPSDFFYLGCSLQRLYGPNAGYGSCKIYLRSLSDLPSNTARGAWLTHLGKCNGLFADGHAESCGPEQLLSTRNGWKSDTDHGIQVWKLEDGSWAP